MNSDLNNNPIFENEPIEHENGRLDLIGYLRNKRMLGAPHAASTNSKQKSAPSSRDTVRFFMSALAPFSPQPSAPLSRELRALQDTVQAVVKAADDNVLTEEEADAVISFIATRFASRRIDDVFRQVTTPSHG